MSNEFQDSNFEGEKVLNSIDIVTRPPHPDCFAHDWSNAWEYDCTCELRFEIERLRAMCDQFAESAKMFGTQWGSEVVDFRINEKKLKRAWLKYKKMRNG